MSGAVPKEQLSRDERLFYRDRLWAARYAALADAEGFEQICFAVEALGMRLAEKQGALSEYQEVISGLIATVDWRNDLAKEFPWAFTQFPALYEKLRTARNDAMHTGAYARHATSAAVELCILLEEAVMTENQSKLKTVGDVMVREVISVEEWHPVAHARHLMLTHSFSFLPVRIDHGWKLISEMSIARFLQAASSSADRKKRLAKSIAGAVDVEASLVCAAKEVCPATEISTLFESPIQDHGRIWLVIETDGSDRLLGILTPFELM